MTRAGRPPPTPSAAPPAARSRTDRSGSTASPITRFPLPRRVSTRPPASARWPSAGTPTPSPTSPATTSTAAQPVRSRRAPAQRQHAPHLTRLHRHHGHPGTPYHYAVTAVDTSANESGLSGEDSGTPQTPPPGDYALQFDGTNDYVTFGPATSTLGTSTFTLEAWVKRASGGTTMTTGSLGFDGSGGRPNGALSRPHQGHGRGKGRPPTSTPTGSSGSPSTGVIGADFEDTAGGVNHPGLGHRRRCRSASGTTSPPRTGAGAGASTSTARTDPLNAGATACPGGDPQGDEHPARGAGGRPLVADRDGRGGPLRRRHRRGPRLELRALGLEIRGGKNLELTSGTGLIGRWGLNESIGTVAADSIGGSPNGTLTNGPSWVAGFVPPVTNHAPVCSDVTLTTNEDVAGSTGSSCTDADSDTLTYSIVPRAPRAPPG